jgi:hypothetical protein
MLCKMNGFPRLVMAVAGLLAAATLAMPAHAKPGNGNGPPVDVPGLGNGLSDDFPGNPHVPPRGNAGDLPVGSPAVNAVPEPSTLLLSLAALGVLARTRRVRARERN